MEVKSTNSIDELCTFCHGNKIEVHHFPINGKDENVCNGCFEKYSRFNTTNDKKYANKIEVQKESDCESCSS